MDGFPILFLQLSLLLNRAPVFFRRPSFLQTTVKVNRTEKRKRASGNSLAISRPGSLSRNTLRYYGSGHGGNGKDTQTDVVIDKARKRQRLLATQNRKTTEYEKKPSLRNRDSTSCAQGCALRLRDSKGERRIDGNNPSFLPHLTCSSS